MPLPSGQSHSRRTVYWSGGIISAEQGTVVKDWGWRLPVALVYPNSYSLGMSNLGVHVIYKMLNDRDDVVCERIFWQRGQKAPESIESARGPGDFSCVAFTLSYEVDYLNIPFILRSSGIPLLSAERNDDHPVLIAGGPAVSVNPAPLASFFDAIAIGEAESILPAIIPVIKAGHKRKKTLELLAGIPGVYVPQHYDGNPVERRYPEDLDGFPTHSVVLTENTELGGLFLIEVERGCSWRCRFCLVSHSFFPVRFRSKASLLEQACEGLKYRPRLGLVGPVVTDHPDIEELLGGLLEMGAGFSLSSLRLKPLPVSLLELIRRGGAESIALAPEAGSERLRRLIGKGFNEADILGAAGRAAATGFRHVKLYFMLGLPDETDADAMEISQLALQSKALSSGKTRFSLNISQFVPKAGTGLQRCGMAETADVERRLQLIGDALRGSGIDVHAESPAWSRVQGAISRGDGSVAEVLSALRSSSIAAWRRAVRETGFDIEHFANADWPEQQPLPWSMVAPS